MKRIHVPAEDAVYYRLAAAYMSVEEAETATQLAERTANHLERSEWLDDPDHWIWELAIDFMGDD